MIVDDEPFNVKLMQKQLREAGYANFVTTTSPLEVTELVVESQPDLLLLDVVMPELNGLEILEHIRNDSSLGHLPVILVTASDDRSTRDRALDVGATDFLSKPLDPTQLLPRVRNALALKRHYDQVRDWAHELEHQVRQRTAQLESSRLELLQCLGRAAEYRDNETGQHVVRVGKYVGLIARELGLDEEAANLLELTAPLHDMGKIGIPDSILLKPGKLTVAENQLMRQHSRIGHRTLRPLSVRDLNEVKHHTEVGEAILSAGQSPLLKTAATIALSHHEKWDGSGYPRGLEGEEIPLEGRIVAVADVFDALASKRPYKPALDPETCFEILEDERGKHFDPRVLDAFLACKEKVLEIRDRYADADTLLERT
jgi:putative two-component system response regulator